MMNRERWLRPRVRQQTREGASDDHREPIRASHGPRSPGIRASYGRRPGIRAPPRPRSPGHRVVVQGLAAGSGHADADEQPGPRGGRASRPAHRVRGLGPGSTQLGRLRCDRAHTAGPGIRRDPAGPVGQAGRCAAHPRVGAPGAHRQLPARAAVGHLGGVPAAGVAGPDHVWPDDRGLLDLHRHPGHPAGDLRDVRRRRGEAVRRLAGRHHHADRGAGRNGRRAAPRGVHERWRLHLRGLRPVADRPAHRARLPGHGGRRQKGGGDIDDALRRATAARDAGTPLSIGLLGNAAEVLPRMLAMGAALDVAPDQTWAHDPLPSLPRGVPFEDMAALRAEAPAGFTARARESMAAHVEAMVGFMDAGAEVFDYGTSIRGEAELAGSPRAFAFPGFVPAYIRPLFCEGRGPFRWAALSGDPADIAATDAAILDLFPGNEPLARWIRMAQQKVRFQGLPARICWLGYGERHLAGLRFNDLVARGKVQAPIVLGRDHLDCGSVASPFRETESMKDGSDAIADWPLLNALLNTASGASWVSIHNGGGVGIGYSQHAGQVTVADGTDAMAKRIERVLTNDPGIGVARHVDAGYDEAKSFAQEKGIKVPMGG